MLLLAAEGAAVVVNDLGAATPPARAATKDRPSRCRRDHRAGGKAVANTTTSPDVGRRARSSCSRRVDAYGELDVVMNNAGILRDRMSFNMTEEEWDAVDRRPPQGSLRGRRTSRPRTGGSARKDTGEPVDAAIVNTASESGLYGNAGQANYAAAKAGIAVDDARHGPRARAHRRAGERIAPVARTRLTEA